jgi:hypothetical protein
MTLTEEGRAAERAQASYISVNLFRLLGRAPMLDLVSALRHE